jgi:hypothetical protein
VTVNDTLLHYVQDDLPFGGVGLSAMGAYHGSGPQIRVDAKSFRQEVEPRARRWRPCLQCVWGSTATPMGTPSPCPRRRAIPWAPQGSGVRLVDNPMHDAFRKLPLARCVNGSRPLRTRQAYGPQPYIAKLEQAILLGATYDLAAQYAGISGKTFERWRQRSATARAGPPWRSCAIA